MTAIDDVRDRVDIVDLVGEHVQLRKYGRLYKGLCPFHEEHTPSFVVYPDDGRWHCFGGCATGGDAFSFLMRLEGLSFPEALERLARRTGVPLEEPSPRAEARKAERDRLRQAMQAAEAYYHAQLLRSPAAGAARAYLSRRGYHRDAAVAFGLGWSPGGRTSLRDELASEFGDEVLLTAGLVRARDAGGVRDAFHGRLMFPIRDVQGRTVGFGARTLDPDGVPKYINSPQSSLFDKGSLLYGLDRAKSAIRVAGRAVIVEGYTDVIRAHTAGFENVIASLGTALTEAHVQLLRRYTQDIVLALDADAAGRAATLRGLDVAREAVSGDVVPVPTAGGWIRYEHRSDVKLHVATLPAGLDPDDVVRDDPEAWGALVASASPMMAYLFDVLTRDLDLGSAEGKTEAADRLLPILAAVPDPVRRAAWAAELAQRTGIDERTLMARVGRPSHGRGSSRSRAAGGGDGRASRPRDAASWLLGQLLLEPRRLRLANDHLRECGQSPLVESDWTRSVERDLFEAVRNAARGEPPPDVPPEHRMDALPEPHADHARLLRDRAGAEPPLAHATEGATLASAALRMREAAVRQSMEGVRALIAEAPPGESAQLGARLRDLTGDLLGLHRLLHAPVAQSPGKTDAAVV